MPNDKPASNRSLQKALRLLDILAARGRPMTLAELSETAGYPKSTTHLLLSTLRNASYVEQRPDGRYFLGIRLYECGQAVSAQWDISAAARPYLEALAEKTGASATLTYLEQGNIIHLEQVAAKNGVQVLSEIGIRQPLHATAAGKLYLATLSDQTVRSLLAAQGMPAFTPHTLTTPDALIAQLPQIRAEGFAVENGEYKIGLRAVSALVRASDGTPRYGIGVSGLFRYAHGTDFDEAVAAALAGAQQLSAALGYRQR